MLKRLLILFAIPLLLSSCAQKNEYKEIVFSSWGSITETQILNSVIQDFEKSNPDIKIKFIHIPQNYFQKLHLLISSNQAPDVMFINNLYLPIYASKLDDLSDIISKDDYYEGSIKALSYDNKLLAVPRDVSNLVFYRNKELISNNPTNLDELIDSISRSKNYGISYERNVYYMFPYTLTLGEDIYKPNKSLQFYKNLEGKYAPLPSEVGSSTLAQMFLEGKIGLYLSGRWLYPKIRESAKFEWDIITFPGTVPLDASGWAISKDSKNKDLAKKFVQYLASENTSKYFLETGLIVPARKDTARNIDNKVFLEAISKSKVIPVKKDYMKSIDKMNKEIFD